MMPTERDSFRYSKGISPIASRRKCWPGFAITGHPPRVELFKPSRGNLRQSANLCYIARMSTKQQKVRIGVIGCGAMGRSHMKSLLEHPCVELVAAADPVAPSLESAVGQFAVRGFSDAQAMLDKDLLDAVLIATPHYSHPTFAIAALERGLHVLVEKPVAVTAQAAQGMIDAAQRHPHLIFAANFQNRSSTKWQRVKQTIDQGAIGALQRVNWIITTWFRTQTYYNTGGWRATWAGEGGGVLLNQCPHNLDMLCWLTGVPRRVDAHVALGKYHTIEVEDEVTAYLEYDTGATGVFITSTGEFPGTDHLEIIGDRGKITVSSTLPDAFELILTEGSVGEFRRTSDQFTGTPNSQRQIVACPAAGVGEGGASVKPPPAASGGGGVTPPSGTGGGTITEMHRNFIAAILENEPLIAPAREGIWSVELANAMLMSGLQRRPIDLPMDRPAYETLLAELVRRSTKK